MTDQTDLLAEPEAKTPSRDPLPGRRDFVLLFDVRNGNPNGDPDAGNMPRMDPETRHGLVSDVSLKRKIRNYVELAHRGEEGRHIYVEEGAILNEKHRQAYRAVRVDDDKTAKAKKLSPKGDAEAAALRDWMCANFYDVRTFGAVMSTGINCGQVRGPVQMTFAESVEPILPAEMSITRMAATNEKERDAKLEGADSDDVRTDNRTMGRKHVVPYALYRAHGFVSAALAERTGFGSDDLDLFWQATQAMFEHDRSAARGEMAVRALVVFEHDNRLGRAPAHALFDRVMLKRVVDGDAYEIGDTRLDNRAPPRAFSDYHVDVDEDDLPDGITVVRQV